MSLDETAAKRLASDARADHGVPTSYAFHGAQRRIIEVTEDPSGVESRVRDVRAWIVRFQTGIAWAELAVDEVTGAIVRVQRSRS
jgi:hypothetical protein